MFCSFGKAQNISISGFVKAAESEESLPFAAIYDISGERGCYSNEDGFYTFSAIANENISLRFSYTGYLDTTILVNSGSDVNLNVYLPLKVLETITVNADKAVTASIRGFELTPLELKKLPVIGGEPDLIKTLTFLPGVASGFEGLSGMFVRGGEQDQNLYLLDGASIYNTGHLFNFFSIYNTAAIKKVKFFKGNFPARYGGRLASVTDIQFKDGNKKELRGEAKLGIINSNITIEGPLGKQKKVSFLLSARSTYLDLFSVGLKKKVRAREKKDYSGITFFDINAKLNYELNTKNKLFFNFYLGKDYYRLLQSFNDINGFDKRLTNFSSSWMYYSVLSPKIFMKISGTVGGYVDYDEKFDEFYKRETTVFDPTNPYQVIETKYILTGTDEVIRHNFAYNFSTKVHFDYAPSTIHNISFGAEILRHTFEPLRYQDVFEQEGSPKETFSRVEPIISALESAVYLEDEIQASSKWMLRPGVRFSSFLSAGAHYSALAPRLSVNFKPSVSASLFMGVSKSAQYLFSINGYGTELAKSIWLPVSKQDSSQSAWLYSLGYSQDMKKHHSFFSIELFYKSMTQLKYFQNNNTERVPFANYESNILNGGNGKSYGMEVSFQKQMGKWSCSANYTLSWNKRKFSQLNDGKWFASKYDRRHDLNLLINYQLNENWSFSAAWVYQTGHRVTLPIAKIPGNEAIYETFAFSGIYGYQLPNYHRLDLSAKWQKTARKNKNIKWQLGFDVYNAYYRRNINSIDFQPSDVVDSDGHIIQKKGIIGTSLFPIIPSLNVGVKF